jgi:Flp pilus assembly protein TadG
MIFRRGEWEQAVNHERESDGTPFAALNSYTPLVPVVCLHTVDVGLGGLVMRTAQRSSQHGSVFVEAAIVSPLLIMLTVSMMQFGYIYGVLANLRGASAVAARMAVLDTANSNSDVCQAAKNAVASLVDTSLLDCQTSPSILPAAANSPVTITLSYPVHILSSSSGLVRGPTFTLSARTTMQ